MTLYSYKYLETRFFHAADWVGQMNDNPKALDQSRMTAFIQYEKIKGIKGGMVSGDQQQPAHSGCLWSVLVACEKWWSIRSGASNGPNESG